MVRFLGYRRDIDRLLAACDAVVSSSRQEGLPLNLIEAAARGRFIIATDVRGNADVVRQSGSGVLVTLNDDEAMAAEIARLCTSAPEAPDRKRIECYDSRAIVKTLFDLYGI
jgi:glycosyltransferase EpsD